ncbi:hypothetical protein DFH27DRAFT_393753 [Peziza echinospora]|nr:hypothetical protein DFH27DRAFT_393753 [Peziza echinospora]
MANHMPVREQSGRAPDHALILRLTTSASLGKRHQTNTNTYIYIRNVPTCQPPRSSIQGPRAQLLSDSRNIASLQPRAAILAPHYLAPRQASPSFPHTTLRFSEHDTEPGWWAHACQNLRRCRCGRPVSRLAAGRIDRHAQSRPSTLRHALLHAKMDDVVDVVIKAATTSSQQQQQGYSHRCRGRTRRATSTRICFRYGWPRGGCACLLRGLLYDHKDTRDTMSITGWLVWSLVMYVWRTHKSTHNSNPRPATMRNDDVEGCVERALTRRGVITKDNLRETGLITRDALPAELAKAQEITQKTLPARPYSDCGNQQARGK